MQRSFLFPLTLFPWIIGLIWLDVFDLVFSSYQQRASCHGETLDSMLWKWLGICVRISSNLLLTGPTKRRRPDLQSAVTQTSKCAHTYRQNDLFETGGPVVDLYTASVMKSPIVADAAQSPSDWKDYV